MHVDLVLANILTTVVLAIQAWILKEIIALKVQLAQTVQKVADLPCKQCQDFTDRKGGNHHEPC
jgi:DNA topoisomerase IB